MRAFRDISIKSKLIAIIMLTSVVTLLVVCIAFVAYDLRAFRRSMVQELSVLGNIIGLNSTASLLFDDRDTAAETLSGLRAEQHIVAACIYDQDGTRFAEYHRDSTGQVILPDTAPQHQARFVDGHLIVAQPIQMGEEIIGASYLKADLLEMNARLIRYAGIVGLVALASIGLAWFLSSRLQNVISAPILALERVARAASHKDYTGHAEKRGNDEIGTLIDGFNDMLTQIRARESALREANRELESFSYSVSHDLRVPLRGVTGLCRVLDEEHSQRLDDEGRRLVLLMRDSAERMKFLIDDLLEFSRLGRKSIDKSRIDMRQMATEVSEELQILEPQRRIEVQVDGLPTAYGDHSMIRQVYVNLLSNAFKFTRDTEAPRIHAGSHQEEEETVYFVRDNGEGFDMKYADKLFQVFQRLHNTKSYEGTGVGLAIVQRIIKRHGGRIWSESATGRGATFYFTLSPE